MAEALILCPEAPYPIAGGGPMRTACLLEYLASKYTVDVITFREPGARDPAPAFPLGLTRSIRVVDLPFHQKSIVARATRNLGRLARGVPPLVDRFAGFQLPLDRDYDLAVIEHFWCAGYVHALRPRCKRVVLDLHNVESVLLNRCAETEAFAGKLAFARFADVCKKLEQDLLPAFDDLLVVSESDRRIVGRGSVVPNAIRITSHTTARARNSIVFSGNMAYHPNLRALRWFHDEVWPLIRRQAPALEWELVGKNSDRLPLALGPRVRALGPVEDAIPVISGARAAVVPLLSGSGTRFKILEAWAADVPVVTTTIGAEGLEVRNGEHVLIADSAKDFADAVSSLVNESGLNQCLIKAGRQLLESSYTWDVVWKRLRSVGL